MQRLKKIEWVGSAKKDLVNFPDEVKDEIGYELYRAQEGKMSHKTKRMRGLGSGVMEIISDYDTNTSVYSFRIYRSGNDPVELTNSTLTVYFQLGGTAVAPLGSTITTNPCFPGVTDYYIGNCYYVGTSGLPTPGGIIEHYWYAIIPAGATNVDIPIRPVLDFQCEETETVILSLMTNSAYKLGFRDSQYFEIYNTDTAFSFANIPEPIILYQGSSFTFEISRSCGAAYPKYLFNTAVTNQFVLTGAQYGTDYVLSSDIWHGVTSTGTNLAVLTVVLQSSNGAITVTFTALTNNLFGGTKTVNIASTMFYGGGCPEHGSSITIVSAGTPIIHSETFNTNAGFQFSILGENNSLCYVLASTNLVNWTNIGSVTLTNSTNRFIDSQATNFLNRFYRVYYTP